MRLLKSNWKDVVEKLEAALSLGRQRLALPPRSRCEKEVNYIKCFGEARPKVQHAKRGKPQFKVSQ